MLPVCHELDMTDLLPFVTDYILRALCSEVSFISSLSD